MVRIPISIQSSIGTSRDNNYKLSFRTWAVLNKPNLICKQDGFLYLGFEVPLEDYIHDCKIIEKGKKMIEGMLEIF
jgi:trimethylamine:corrinoid methyltransferase-like protein